MRENKYHLSGNPSEHRAVKLTESHYSVFVKYIQRRTSRSCAIQRNGANFSGFGVHQIETQANKPKLL